MNIFALTGAGASAESGLGTFRDRDGLWFRFDPMKLATPERGEFETFIRVFGRPAERQGLPDPSGPPTPEQAEALARACRQFGIEFVGPPLS